MDAPLYPPAVRFEQPLRLPRIVDSANTPIAELMKITTAWAVVVAEIPGIEDRLSVPMLKPHLGNFTLRSLVQFGFSTSEQLDRVDAKLKSLGEVK